MLWTISVTYLLPSLFPDSNCQVTSNVSIPKQHVLSEMFFLKSFKGNLFPSLNSSHSCFSLMKLTTDVSTTKELRAVVQFFDDDANHVSSHFFRL